MATKYSTTLINARLDAITTAVGNAGVLRIYSGTRPANVAAAITGTILAELTCGTPFAAGAAAGVLSPTLPTTDASANATGTATHFRVFTSGAVAVVDGDVSTSGSDLNLTTTSIVATQPVSIASWTITGGQA